MKSFRRIVAGLLVPLALLAAVPALARVDVDVNIGVPVVPPPAAPGYPYPPPAYVSPPPRYLEPPPAPVYVYPPPAYVYPAPPRWRDPHHEWRERHRDRDGDGVPDRWDHRPNDPWRR
jgi:hypothetical protein